MSQEKPKFDELEIQRQVLSAMGVSTPELETVPLPRPPFHTIEDCCEACLAFPGPLDEEFVRQPAPARALAVLAAFEMERGTGGVRQALENLDTAYILKMPDALRQVGLFRPAEALDAWLRQALEDLDKADFLEVPEPRRLAGLFRPAEGLETWLQQALGTLPGDAAAEDEAAGDLLREKLQFGRLREIEGAADWRAVPGALMLYANSHPEIFTQEEDR
jgi:hypothetical protein